VGDDSRPTEVDRGAIMIRSVMWRQHTLQHFPILLLGDES
jgi:hypothetical protein